MRLACFTCHSRFVTITATRGVSPLIVRFACAVPEKPGASTTTSRAPSERNRAASASVTAVTSELLTTRSRSAR